MKKDEENSSKGRKHPKKLAECREKKRSTVFCIEGKSCSGIEMIHYLWICHFDCAKTKFDNQFGYSTMLSICAAELADVYNLCSNSVANPNQNELIFTLPESSIAIPGLNYQKVRILNENEKQMFSNIFQKFCR